MSPPSQGDDAGKPPAAAYCADRSVKLGSGTKAEWNGWSPALTNTRYQSNEAAGLSFADVPRLKLKWSYGFDGDIVAFSEPAVLKPTCCSTSCVFMMPIRSISLAPRC